MCEFPLFLKKEVARVEEVYNKFGVSFSLTSSPAALRRRPVLGGLAQLGGILKGCVSLVSLFSLPPPPQGYLYRTFLWEKVARGRRRPLSICGVV